MSGQLLTVIIVVGTALAFDFTNGFHDTANVVATSISTRAMAPRLAVGYASLLNFVGAFISLKVAATVAKDVVDPAEITLLVVFGGLVGAISHAWTDGRRDFASTAQTRADHYEVQVEDGYATEAQRLLSTMPAT